MKNGHYFFQKCILTDTMSSVASKSLYNKDLYGLLSQK